MQLTSCFLLPPWYLQPAKLANAYVSCYYKAALKNLMNLEFQAVLDVSAMHLIDYKDVSFAQLLMIPRGSI